MSELKLHNDIVTSLKAIVDENGDRVFHTVGLWNDQILEANEGKESPFNYPACFIQFAEIPWTPRNDAGGSRTNITEEQQGGLSVIRIHICHSHLENVEDSFPLIHPKNLQVYYAIQGMPNTALYSRLNRISGAIPETNHDRIQDWQMEFSVTMVQTGQILNKTTIEAGTLSTTIVE
tara:strand:+ start:7561 stop:8091 length:531 start_codon:yes stop_codon:yes gene_type:complete